MAMPVVKMVTLNTILLLYKCTCKNIATLFLGIVATVHGKIWSEKQNRKPFANFYLLCGISSSSTCKSLTDILPSSWFKLTHLSSMFYLSKFSHVQ